MAKPSELPNLNSAALVATPTIELWAHDPSDLVVGESQGGAMVEIQALAPAVRDLIGRPTSGEISTGTSTVPRCPSAADLKAAAEAHGGALTGAEIKALYEAEADTNAFTDAEKSKLAGLSALDVASLRSLYFGLTPEAPVNADYLALYDASGTMIRSTPAQVVSTGLAALSITPMKRVSDTLDPSVNDDADAGFALMDQIHNTVEGTIWSAVDVTNGAAIYEQIAGPRRDALLFKERASSGWTAVAGYGGLYVKDTGDGELTFVDSAGTEHTVAPASGGSVPNLTIRFADGVNPVNIFQSATTPKIVDDGTLWKVDLSAYSEVRLKCMKGSADNAGYRWGFGYKTGNPTKTAGDYSNPGVGDTEISLDIGAAPNADTYFESSWIALRSEVQAEVSIALIGFEQDASGNVAMDFYEMEFRA